MPPETLRTLAADLIAELRHLDRRIAKAASDIQTARSIDSAAASFATYTGTTPIDLSSGDVVRQGLSCAGDPPIQSLSMSWPLPRCGKTPRAGPITYASEAKAKVITKKRCDASNDDYPTSSTDNSAGQAFPPSSCKLLGVEGLNNSNIDSAGARIDPTQFDTVYVDVSCRGG